MLATYPAIVWDDGLRIFMRLKLCEGAMMVINGNRNYSQLYTG